MGLLAPIKQATHFGSMYIKILWKMIQVSMDPSDEHTKTCFLAQDYQPTMFSFVWKDINEPSTQHSSGASASMVNLDNDANDVTILSP
ncbi:unnamed protein product [Prunus brigantina]